MICTECNEVIPFEDDVTVRVVYSDGRGVESHCKHNPFDESDPAIIAILGSKDCFNQWTRQQAALAN